MSRTYQDDPSLPGAGPGLLAKIGPRTVRTRIFVLFGLLMAGTIGLSHILYGRHGAVVAVSLAALVTGAVFAFLLGRQITRPLIQMTRTAEKVAGGDLKQRARVYGRDEAGVLARTFNAMLDGLEKTCRDLEGRVRVLEDEAGKKAASSRRTPPNASASRRSSGWPGSRSTNSSTSGPRRSPGPTTSSTARSWRRAAPRITSRARSTGWRARSRGPSGPWP